MDLVIKIIKEAMQENLSILLCLMIIVAALYAINCIMGAILGGFKEGFDWKKFLFGILKGIIAAACIFAFGFILNMFAAVLNLIKVEISTDLITILEVIGIFIVWAIDLSKDIIDKIKGLKELKYISYEDVKVIDFNISSDQADEVVAEDVGGLG